MKNKLIALVEVLMIVSLFCVGYASWAISPPDTATQGGSMISYDVTVRSLATYGLSLSTDGAKTFTYCTVTAGEGEPVTQYTNTSLSLQIKVERAKLAEWAQNEYRGETMVISCLATGNEQYSSYSLFRSYMSNVQAKVTLQGYPNLSLTPTVALPASYLASYPLTISIPMEQLYNLIILDKANQNSTYSTLELVIECTENVQQNDGSRPGVEHSIREEICSLTYSFTAKLVKN